jgi:hypothetical protein
MLMSAIVRSVSYWMSNRFQEWHIKRR